MGAFRVVVATIIVCFLVTAESTNYEGYKLYKLSPTTRNQYNVLRQLAVREDLYDFLSLDKVIINPKEIIEFKKTLQQNDITFQLLDENMGQTLRYNFEQNRLLRNRLRYNANGRLDTNQYYSHDAINAYLQNLAQRFSQRVFLKKMGRSFEGRDLYVITITNGDGRNNTNVILVDGGIHAREWISPASVIYAIEQLVENFEENKDLLEDFDWVVLPVVNPDGYEYSQHLPETRLWRKTRKPLFHEGGICYGVDANRNFDIHWNQQDGASSDPCSNNFAGPKPFSEPEVMVVRDLIHTYIGRGQMYLTLHSQGQLLLYPWGWTYDLPDTWEDLHEVGKAGAEAINASTGTNYTVGSTTNVLYVAAGVSADYAYAAGFPISLTMELPSGGTSGFDPPVEVIDRLVKETWAGIRAMGLKVIEKYPLVV